MMCGEKIPEKEYDEFVIDTMLLKHLCNLVDVTMSFQTIVTISKEGWDVGVVNAEHTMMGFFKIPATSFKVFTPIDREVELEFKKISDDINNFKYKKYPDHITIKMKKDKYLISDGIINRERGFTYPDHITIKMKKDKYLISDGIINRERGFTNEGPPKPSMKRLDYKVKFEMESEFVKRVCKAYENANAIDFMSKGDFVCIASQDDGGNSIAKSDVKAPEFCSTFTRSYIADAVEHLSGKVKFSTSTDYPMLIETNKPFPTTFFIAPRTAEEPK